MEIRRHTSIASSKKGCIKLLTATLSLAAMGACATPRRDYYLHHERAVTPVRFADNSLVQWSDLKNGDLVMGGNISPINLLNLLTYKDFSEYVHVGVVVWENQRPYVYEALGHLQIFRRSKDLLGMFDGSIDRNSFENFIRRYRWSQVVRLPNGDKNQELAKTAAVSTKEDLRFDPYFDIGSPAVYCTEYVDRLLGQVHYGLQPNPSMRTENPGLVTILESLGIRSKTFFTASSFLNLPLARTVCTVDCYGQESGALVSRESLRILHERFTTDPQSEISAYLHYDDQSFLVFSPQVQMFLDLVNSYFASNPTTDVQEIRRVQGIIYEEVFKTERSI